MAVALSGCVITKDEGKKFKYVRKCEKCGHILNGEHTGYGNYNQTFNCPKCKQKNKLIIKK